MKNKKAWTYTIAEIGQAHDGSLGILHSYIEALATTGVDAVKFQMHIAEAESSEYETFRIPFSYQDATRFDYWKRMSFSPKEWKGIKDHCEDLGLDFICSPFSIAAVEVLEELGTKCYKIGSGEVSNHLMLRRIAETGKPIILSSGMSDFEEIQSAVDFLKPYENDLTILQCTTSYPTKPDQIGLNVIAELQNRFKGIPIGFSDHSGQIYACLAAATLGARVLEFHVVFDKQMFGPDATSSLTINEVDELVRGVKFIETALENPIDKANKDTFSKERKIFGKSLAINKKLSAGHQISFDDLESKKPADFGIPANEFESVIGKQLNKNLNKYDFLNWEDLQ